MNVRLALSDPSVKDIAKASCSNNSYYNQVPKLSGEANWQGWSDALQHAALMAGADAVLNGESKHPPSLDEQQIWRSRNESLLKAMRGASDVDFSEFGALNAHDTYISLKLKYRVSDSQQAFELFSEEFMLVNELDDSPRDAANEFQDAFNRYNHLVGHNTEQRLPENFLKMAFLYSLDDEYADWRKALLKDRNVLELDEASTLTFDELVDLTIAERSRLLQEQANNTTAAPATTIQQPLKRNIPQVDEPAHSNNSSSDDSGSDENNSEAEGIQQSKTVPESYGKWRVTAAAHHALVKAQIDVVTAGREDSGNKRHKYSTLRGDLTGEWLLYNKGYNPGTGGQRHIRLWNTTSKNLKRLHPDNQRYKGELSIGPHGKVETFDISQFSPPHHVTGRPLQITFTRPGRDSRVGGMTFWGKGRMMVKVPAPLIGKTNGKILVLEFAAVQTKKALHSTGASTRIEPDNSDDRDGDDDDDDDCSSSGDCSDNAESDGAEERYDRVIRTDRHASVAIKMEEDKNTAMARDTEEPSTAVAIKAEESDSSDSDDE
ncbi:hypothetical protein E4T50_14605 [Aureobasidium sp. EXF-12298]|nr:hypothetical protein E4T50_14605 [Aureobasidium sp. EXF-12298]